jgi:hypothetical protein
MHPVDHHGSIEALIVHDEFQDLKQRLSECTLFDVLGISLEERIHSKMLGWLLDPSESHGLGDRFLRRFLYEAAKLARTPQRDFKGNGRPMLPLEAETFSFSDLRLQAEYCLSEDRRLDLVLCSQGEGWLCIIENKILAGEGVEQTNAYYEEALARFPAGTYRSRLFVYLSPQGSEPVSKHFVPLRYSTVEGLLTKGQDSASAFGRVAIDQYVKCLRRIVEQEHLQNICRRLYRNHRLAIDTIVRYGKTNELATMTAARVLQLLGTEAISPGRQLEWKSKPTSNWIAIWPDHWPTKPGKWVVHYEILPTSPQGAYEGVSIGISFGQANVRMFFKDLADKSGAQTSRLLHRDPEVAKEINDLERVAESAAVALVTRVKESFELMEAALRLAFPEWNGSNDA